MKLFYHLDTGWGCGGITVENDIVIKEGTAPIFKRFIGQNYTEILKKGGYRSIETGGKSA